MAARVFRPGGKFKFNWVPESHQVYYGTAVDGEENALDEVWKDEASNHLN
jgi:tRNA modification GTPase